MIHTERRPKRSQSMDMLSGFPAFRLPANPASYKEYMHMKRLLGVVAIALALTGLLAGCAGHGRLASRIRPAGHVASATGGSTDSTAGAAPAARSTSAAGSSTTTAQLATVQQQLTLLNTTMNAIDANITQADKAADSDNQ